MVKPDNEIIIQYWRQTNRFFMEEELEMGLGEVAGIGFRKRIMTEYRQGCRRSERCWPEVAECAAGVIFLWNSVGGEIGKKSARRIWTRRAAGQSAPALLARIEAVGNRRS